MFLARLIAYFTQLNLDFTFDEIERWSQKKGLQTEYVKPTLNSYLFFSNQDNHEKNNSKISFINRTYQEFLLAEYLIERYIEDDTLGLNIGKPSETTIDFFKGFLVLLNADNKAIYKFVFGDESNRNTLFYSLGYKPDVQVNVVKEGKEKILNTAIKSFNDDTIYILKSDNLPENQTIDSLLNELKWFKSFDSECNSYQNLWLHRWTSLITLRYLNKKTPMDKKKLVNLIIYTSHNIPSYLKCLSSMAL